MAAIPQMPIDPTLEAVDAAIEARGNRERARPYLGMSEIGRPCSRALWYGFRWCSPSQFDAATLKRFEDGHGGEDIQADRLRLVPAIVLYTTDPRTPGEQFGFKDVAGHFRGHSDGAILGLLQAPKAWHVWEHKQVGDKKQAALLKAREKHGEKGALQAWDEVYYAQAVLYMHYAGFDRHYLTCASAGGRHTVSVRTNADADKATALVERARTVISAAEPLPKLSEDPAWYQCKWCNHQAVCHQGAVPQVTCRTCVHATPEMDGDGRWSCAMFQVDLTTDTQRVGAQCPGHVFIPGLLPWKAMNASQDENWVEYEKPDGTVIRNGPGGYASREIAASPEALGDPVLDEIRSVFGAEISASQVPA